VLTQSYHIQKPRKVQILVPAEMALFGDEISLVSPGLVLAHAYFFSGHIRSPSSAGCE
jgi:hypothetical protein